MKGETRSILVETAARMFTMAKRLDKMVEESRSGGWSTHQSTEQTRQANDLRRWASELLDHED